MLKECSHYNLFGSQELMISQFLARSIAELEREHRSIPFQGSTDLPCDVCGTTYITRLKYDSGAFCFFCGIVLIKHRASHDSAFSEKIKSNRPFPSYYNLKPICISETYGANPQLETDSHHQTATSSNLNQTSQQNFEPLSSPSLAPENSATDQSHQSSSGISPQNRDRSTPATETTGVRRQASVSKSSSARLASLIRRREALLNYYRGQKSIPKPRIGSLRSRPLATRLCLSVSRAFQSLAAFFDTDREPKE